MIPGPLSYQLYQKLVDSDPNLSISLIKQSANVAVITATFAFTMLGLLAAIITILFSFSKTVAFNKYLKGNYLSVFFTLYYEGIFFLMVTFLLAIITLTSSDWGGWALRYALMSTVNNLWQIGMIIVIIVNMCKKSLSE